MKRGLVTIAAPADLQKAVEYYKTKALSKDIESKVAFCTCCSENGNWHAFAALLLFSVIETEEKLPKMYVAYSGQRPELLDGIRNVELIPIGNASPGTKARSFYNFYGKPAGILGSTEDFVCWLDCDSLMYRPIIPLILKERNNLFIQKTKKVGGGFYCLSRQWCLPFCNYVTSAARNENLKSDQKVMGRAIAALNMPWSNVSSGEYFLHLDRKSSKSPSITNRWMALARHLVYSKTGQKPSSALEFMNLYKHQSYAHYKKSQTKKNIKKFKRIFATRKELMEVANLLENMNILPKFGICHGIRNGWEVQQLTEYLRCEIVGTDISETVTQLPFGVQHDFHEEKPDWIGKADFVYSNSLDHSYDPAKCLKTWMASLTPSGICFVGWQQKTNNIDAADCFSGTFIQLSNLIHELGFFIVEIIKIRPDYHLFAISATCPT